MKPVKIPKEQRESLLDHIQEYFEVERGENIGRLAAESLLEFFVKELGPSLYNQALSDCRMLTAQRMQGLEEDIYALEWKEPRR